VVTFTYLARPLHCIIPHFAALFRTDRIILHRPHYTAIFRIFALLFVLCFDSILWPSLMSRDLRVSKSKNGRIKFLALKPTIEADIAAGYYAKTVFQKHEQALGIRYRQFMDYCVEYGLNGRRPVPPARASAPAAGPPVSPSPRATPPPPRSPGASAQEPARGFHFDPTAAYRKKDLI
jgi:hypothetical protein